MAKKKKNFNKSGNGSNGAAKMVKEKPVYCNFFYMTNQTADAEDLYQIITNEAGKNAQLWKDAQIIEVELADKLSIDIEKMSYAFRDEEDLAFIESHKIKTVYCIETEAKCVSELKVVFQMITTKLGGFVCSDSDNFEPVLCGQE